MGTCWPQAKANFTVIRPCPKLYFKNDALISRLCNENGVWEPMNISSCVRHSEQESHIVGLRIAKQLGLVSCHYMNRVTEGKQSKDYEHEISVFVALSWVTVTVLFLSLLVLLSLRTNEYERFKMDRHLLFAFLMRTATFFIDYYTGLSRTASLKSVCNFLWIWNRYFAVAEITWMFNEAIYLLRKIRNAFDNTSYYRHFVLWGWGFPFVLTIFVYTPMIHLLHPNELRCWSHLGQSLGMLVLYVPLTLMLLFNFGIMIYVIKVLIQKMRKENYSEAKIVWKTAKGAIMLMPALGFIYLITFYTPVGNVEFDVYIRVLHPMQGVLVCFVNVALNGEVQYQLSRRWRKWAAKRCAM
ncbi:hypothetical protein QZH41_013402, partial [Actinostola sp. cb2023]